MRLKSEKPLKLSRIIFRCLPDDITLINKAAELDGRTVPDFLRFHLKEASESIILKNQQKNAIPTQQALMQGVIAQMQSLGDIPFPQPVQSKPKAKK